MSKHSSAPRIVIVAAGNLNKEPLERLKGSEKDTVFVGADRGALRLLQHGFPVDCAFGDFDSVDEAEMELIRREAKQLHTFDKIDKDWTDTELALQWAIRQKPRQIVLLGAVGTRADHSLSNLFLLKKGLEAGVDCVMIDGHNEIRLIDQACTVVRGGILGNGAGGDYAYVSLLSLSERTTGITLQGFQYPLENAVLHLGESRGVSNVLIADTGTIRIASGLLLVIQSRD